MLSFWRSISKITSIANQYNLANAVAELTGYRMLTG